MPHDLKIRNIVLVGLFNLNDFDKYFFIKNEILAEGDFQNNYIYQPPNIIQINTKTIQVVILPTQFIATSLNPLEVTDNIATIVRLILKNSKTSSISGLGINFQWFFSDEKKSMHEISKQFINPADSVQNSEFNTQDSHFGLYMSKNFKDARLKLDIKPSIISEKSNKIEAIQFAFNFHFEINSTNVEDIDKFLSDYADYYQKASNIMSFYNYE